jgi:hypothetical protein
MVEEKKQVVSGGSLRKRKKAKIVRHVLHEDCRECRRKMFAENPLVREISSIENFKESTFHLYHTKNTMPYLLEMTKLSGMEIVRIFAETGNKDLSQTMGDYFSDIEQILRMVINMKVVTNER